MRILADEQFNELNEHIKQLEAENKYLKKLLDDAGIPYDKANKALEKNESKHQRRTYYQGTGSVLLFHV